MCDRDHFHRLEDRADRRRASLILTVALKKTSRLVTYSTNGIPARLAAARAKRAAQLNACVIVTNIETTANAPAK